MSAQVLMDDPTVDQLLLEADVARLTACHVFADGCHDW